MCGGRVHGTGTGTDTCVCISESHLLVLQRGIVTFYAGMGSHSMPWSHRCRENLGAGEHNSTVDVRHKQRLRKSPRAGFQKKKLEHEHHQLPLWARRGCLKVTARAVEQFVPDYWKHSPLHSFQSGIFEMSTSGIDEPHVARKAHASVGLKYFECCEALDSRNTRSIEASSTICAARPKLHLHLEY